MNPVLRRLAGVVVAAALTVACGSAARAQLFETKAKEAFLMDGATGTVLFAKNEDKPVPPASLAKLMTIELLFGAIKSGRLSLTDTFQISEHAWRDGGAASGGSTMFAKVHSSVPVEALIQGIVVQSANDACIAVAEGMAGSEAAFAQMMTNRAHELGLNDMSFGNATGLPDPKNKVTMREMALLARHIHDTYPDLYHYFAEDSFTWNGIRQRNRNPLIGAGIGADGLKTGYIEDSGYAVVGSLQQDGRRLYLAMSGMSSDRERSEEARKLIEWGMRAFEKKNLFAEGAIVGQASVYGGAQTALPLKAKGPIDIFLPSANPDGLKARIVYHWPIMAPVEEGAKVAELKVYIGDTLSQVTPLYAAQSVPKGPLYKQALDAFEELSLSWMH
ncbi:MAG: D-alanyl-D-alanine carboxypeptidase family protein [Pararhizobium sp.]